MVPLLFLVYSLVLCVLGDSASITYTRGTSFSDFELSISISDISVTSINEAQVPNWVSATYSTTSGIPQINLKYTIDVSTLEAGTYTAEIGYLPSSTQSLFISLRVIADICEAHTNCSECRKDYRCGWCLESNSCSTIGGSLAAPCKNYFNNTCPRLCSSECMHGTCDYRYGYCRCESGFGGKDCSCQHSVDCSGHGTCGNTKESSCECKYGFGGPACNLTCDQMCSGAANSCQGTRCSCRAGRTGPDCSLYTCPSLGCNGGTCDQTTGTCICPPNQYGKDCRQYVCTVDCTPGGYCGRTLQCECKPAYYNGINIGYYRNATGHCAKSLWCGMMPNNMDCEFCDTLTTGKWQNCTRKGNMLLVYILAPVGAGVVILAALAFFLCRRRMAERKKGEKVEEKAKEGEEKGENGAEMNPTVSVSVGESKL